MSTAVWMPVLAGIVSAIVIVALISHESRLFGMGWLRYLGKVSYGWYLWHAPFLSGIKRFNDSPEKRIAFALITLFVASLSWQFIERQFLIDEMAGGSPTNKCSMRI